MMGVYPIQNNDFLPEIRGFSKIIENKLLRGWILLKGNPEFIKGLKCVINEGEGVVDFIPKSCKSIVVSVIKKTPALKDYLQMGKEFENLFMLMLDKKKNGSFHLNTVFHEGVLKDAIEQYLIQLKNELVTCKM